MFSVEANIGAGKSTFLRIFGERWSDIFKVIFEPLDEWQTRYADINNNILGMFYEDIPRWAYTFQSNAFITRIQKYQAEKSSELINLTERSVLSDYHIFAKMLKDDGKMNEVEWKLYENWYNWLCDKFQGKPEAIIYLRCDPQISYERVRRRSRSEEETISLDYLTRLHQYHDQWLLNETEIPVMVVNVDEDFEGNEERIERMYSDVINFYNQ